MNILRSTKRNISHLHQNRIGILFVLPLKSYEKCRIIATERNWRNAVIPTLEWIGKEKVVNHHQEVPFRVLERRYNYDSNGQTEADNGSENMIIHGDNLEALKALLPKYEGRVRCIYIDIYPAY